MAKGETLKIILDARFLIDFVYLNVYFYLHVDAWGGRCLGLTARKEGYVGNVELAVGYKK